MSQEDQVTITSTVLTADISLLEVNGCKLARPLASFISFIAIAFFNEVGADFANPSFDCSFVLTFGYMK